MVHWIRGSLFVLALAAFVPRPAQAQLFRHLFNDCCMKCSQPLCSCTCCVEPVVDTCLQPTKCVNYKQVTCTATRKEAYTETVPVQKAHNICVDEGCWKMVWCPKPVVKTVCKTEYQQRVCYRNVPYNYCVTVPEVTTSYVPTPRVRYAKRQCGPFHPVCPPVPCAPAPVSCAAPVAPTCAAPSCAAPQVVMGDAGDGMAAALPAPLTMQMAQVPAMPAPATPAAQAGAMSMTAAVPAPVEGYVPASGNAAWMTVPVRMQQTAAAAQPAGTYATGQQMQMMVQPAAAPQSPSAAAVWQARPTTPAF